MTDAATYLALAERVEKLTGPDRELSALVRCAVFAPDTAYVAMSSVNGAWCIYHGETRDYRPRCWEPRGLTDIQRNGDPLTSLDAAASLVPAGLWAEGSLGTHNSTRSALEIHGPGTFDPVGKAWAATPAIALTAASLRALAASAQGNQ